MQDIMNLRQCYRKTFADETGLAVLKDLEARAFVRDTSFSPDPQRAAFNEGRRSLALHILHMLERVAPGEAGEVRQRLPGA